MKIVLRVKEIPRLILKAKKMPIGTVSTHGGVKKRKTVKGWVPVGKDKPVKTTSAEKKVLNNIEKDIDLFDLINEGIYTHSKTSDKAKTDTYVNVGFIKKDGNVYTLTKQGKTYLGNLKKEAVQLRESLGISAPKQKESTHKEKTDKFIKDDIAFYEEVDKKKLNYFLLQGDNKAKMDSQIAQGLMQKKDNICSLTETGKDYLKDIKESIKSLEVKDDEPDEKVEADDDTYEVTSYDKPGKVAGIPWDSNMYQASSDWLGGDELARVRLAVRVYEDGATYDKETYGYYGSGYDRDHIHKRADELLSHMYHIADATTLYRGTGLKAWELAQVGDTIPFGIGSFSKAFNKAATFGSTVLKLESPVGVTGIDFDSILNKAEDINVLDGITRRGGKSYTHEREVLLRAKSLRIKSIKEIKDKVEGEYVKNIITLELVDAPELKKSRDDILIELSKEFDSPLHRKAKDEENTLFQS